MNVSTPCPDYRSFSRQIAHHEDSSPSHIRMVSQKRGVFRRSEGRGPKNFSGGKPPDPQFLLASLAILPPQRQHHGYATDPNPNDQNLAWINPKSFLKHYSIVNLNIDTLFVDIGALRVDILIFKGQVCLHLQTRALVFWPKQILKAKRISQQ